MSKKTIKEDVPELPTSFFGTIDTGLFLTYASAQFVSGQIGDYFNKRKVLTISYATQATLFMAFGLVGYYAYTNSLDAEDATVPYMTALPLLTVIFMGVGLVNSVDQPTLISVMGNWTHRGNRGFVTGLWSTCGSIGNIMGLQLAPLLLGEWENQWYVLILIIACLYYVISVSMSFFLIPNPKDVGICIAAEESNYESQERKSEVASSGYQPIDGDDDAERSQT